MSITSGGKSYNPSFPVANVNNNSKGFRDNFATIKFAIESLQTAQTGGAVAGGLTSNGSILKLTASPDTSNGAVMLKAEFNSTGFRLPQNRPASPAAGMICYENGVLFFHNGTVWQTFIERVGDTVTLPNLVVTTKLSINYSPSAPTDAVSVKWVQDYIAALPSAGMDPAIYTRLENLEGDLADEIEVRAQEDSRIEGLITAERARITAHDTLFTQVDQQIAQTEADLNQRMDGVESLVESISGDFTTLSQSVQAAVTQVNDLSQAVANDIEQEKAERIAADDALGARIDALADVGLADLAAELEAERQARLAGDATLQQGLTATNTNLLAERDARTSADGLQNNRISALQAAFDQANAIVLGMSDRIDLLADDLNTEKSNREAGDIAERNLRTQAVNALGQRIDTETTNRTNADTALGQRIDTEASARQSADTALGQRIDTETSNRTNADAALGGRIDTETTNRTAADAALDDRVDAESQARSDADEAETSARQSADAALGGRIDTETTNRTNADTALGGRIDTEISDRAAADAALNARIDSLESSNGSNDYLDKSDGGTVSGPVTFTDDLTVSNATLSLQNSTFELPGSSIKIDAGQNLFFEKLPNSSGVGDGGFVTFRENDMRYAVHATQAMQDAYAADVAANGKAVADSTREFSVMVVGSTNDPSNDSNADNVALEPAADLFLNPGWSGTGAQRVQNIGISAVYVGDAFDWRLRINRASGDLFTKGAINATGDIQGLSDESVKDNVRQITGALDKIEALLGVMYERNDQDGKASTGLIAQNVKLVMPEVVGQREDGKLTVAYGNLMGLVVEAIKELRAEVNALKK